MSTPDYTTLRKVLQEAAELTARVAAKADAAPLEAICKRLEQEKPTFKELRGPVYDAMNRVGIRLNEILYDEFRSPRPDMDGHVDAGERIWPSFLKVLYPPPFQDIDISGFSSSELVKEKTAGYKGEPKAVRPIVERSIDLIQRYTALIGRGDFDAA